MRLSAFENRNQRCLKDRDAEYSCRRLLGDVFERTVVLSFRVSFRNVFCIGDPWNYATVDDLSVYCTLPRHYRSYRVCRSACMPCANQVGVYEVYVRALGHVLHHQHGATTETILDVKKTETGKRDLRKNVSFNFAVFLFIRYPFPGTW